jgi:hypothetical protein
VLISNIHGLNNATDKTNNSDHTSNIFPNNLTNEPQLNLPTVGGGIVFYKHYFIYFVFIYITCRLDWCKPNE